MSVTRSVVAAVRRGGPNVLQEREEELLAPAAHEVQVRVHAAGVAYGDMLLREGLVPGLPYPRVPGYDAVGELTMLGSRVTGLGIGQRVALRTEDGTGGYATSLNAPADLVVPVPDEVDSAVAVPLVLNFLTAWQMLTRVTPLPSGSAVLVHSASGGVGGALVDLGQHLGLRVIGTASARRAGALSERGVQAFDRGGDWRNAVLQAAPKGVQAVFDGVGGSTARRSLGLLAPGGTLVQYGVTGALKGGRRSVSGLLGGLVTAPRRSTTSLFASGVGIAGYASSLFVPAHRAWFRDDLAALLRLTADGIVRPMVAEEVPFRAAARAHELQAKGVSGKIIISPAT